jgi:arylsulfatase
VRSRAYFIEAHASLKPGDEGVLIAHGDATCGYSLFVRNGRLVYDMNVGGAHATTTSDAPLPSGRHRFGVAVRHEPGKRLVQLLVDGEVAGGGETELGFHNFISWSGLDIGRDRGSPVADYEAPFSFTGKLDKVTVTMDPDQVLDGEAIGEAEMARQ